MTIGNVTEQNQDQSVVVQNSLKSDRIMNGEGFRKGEHRTKMTIHAVDLIVSGYVQGVGFRRLCAEHAWSIGVAGWVKNRSDSRVEVHLEGTRKQINEMKKWCQRGPSFSSVSNVIETPAVNTSANGFMIY